MKGSTTHNIFRTLLTVVGMAIALSAGAQTQRFFNLTVEDIAIDSMLPEFKYSIPLGKNYQDSIYTLTSATRNLSTWAVAT